MGMTGDRTATGVNTNTRLQGGKPMIKLPPSGAGDFSERYPDVWERYCALGEACAGAGPLDGRTRRLVKLAAAIAVRSEGAVHAHVRQALEANIPADELRQVAVLSIPSVGFPQAMAGLSWINDIVNDT